MKKLLFILFFSSFFIACPLLKDDPYVDFDKEAFKSAKNKWASLNSQNYSFSYSIYGDAYGPNTRKVNVKVVDGLSSFTVTYEDEDEAQYYEEEDSKNPYPTVNSLFNLIQTSYDEDCIFVEKKPKGVYYCDLDVTYDKASGIPTSISDSIVSSGSWVGDWFSMEITDIDVK